MTMHRVIRDEQVIFHDDTAVLIGRLQIEGEMQPVGAGDRARVLLTDEQPGEASDG